MKLAIFLMIGLVAVVVDAQRPTSRPTSRPSNRPTNRPDSDNDDRRDCLGEPRDQNCRDRVDEGRGGRGCRDRAGTKWYYSTRERRCQTLEYLGCGGNGNRYCNRRDCERSCERRGGGRDDVDN